MRKNILNHHKIRRRIERRLRKTSADGVSVSGYGGGRRRNPFRRESGSYSWRTRIEIISLVCISAFFIWCITSYSFFQVRTIRIQGLQRIAEQDVREVVNDIFHHTAWVIFPGTSYIFVDVHEIRDILKARFPFETVVVEKTFPNTVSVTLTEKLSTIIYDNETTYSYLGLDGQIVEIVRAVDDTEWVTHKMQTTTTLADGSVRTDDRIIDKVHTPPVASIEKILGSYPVLYDKRKKTVEVNAQVLDPSVVAHVISWYELLHTQSTIPLLYFTIEDVPGIQGTAVTSEGWIIKIAFTDNPLNAFQRLDAVMKDVPRPRLEYVDLRYPDMVYWK